jgi:hypothetical protein
MELVMRSVATCVVLASICAAVDPASAWGYRPHYGGYYQSYHTGYPYYWPWNFYARPYYYGYWYPYYGYARPYYRSYGYAYGPYRWHGYRYRYGYRHRW